MIDSHLIQRLDEIHQTLIDLVETADADEYQCPQHPDLSPLGWHLAHTAFVEHLWLYERVLDQPLERALHRLYLPENCPDKAERGRTLQDKSTLIAEVRKKQETIIDLLRTTHHKLALHRLMDNDYLVKFLIQHHSQHIETMRMIKAQYLITHTKDTSDFHPQSALTLKQPIQSFELIEFKQKNDVEIGSRDNWGFDNEMPHHIVTLKSFAIAKTPVTNRQYLQFIEDDGYHQPHYWSKEGKQWLDDTQTSAPDGWCKTSDGWYQIHFDNTNGYELVADNPVFGINYFEAIAYINYVNARDDLNARLPHEYEWEYAMNSSALAQTQYSWEWCSNLFHPYEGFTAFPYPNYSPPSFDGAHYTLRGGSRFTQRECARPSFRNFYTPDKRHIFAGLRLAI